MSVLNKEFLGNYHRLTNLIILLNFFLVQIQQNSVLAIKFYIVDKILKDDISVIVWEIYTLMVSKNQRLYLTKR